jgi:hypothetical protein
MRLPTSTISAGAPSPRIVAPLNSGSPSRTPSNCLTTISCWPVSSSTINPARRSAISSTTTWRRSSLTVGIRSRLRSRISGSTSSRRTSTSRPFTVRTSADSSSTVSFTWVIGSA